MLLVAGVAKYLGTGWGDLLNTTPRSPHEPVAWIERIAGISWRIFQVYRADFVETGLLVAGIILVGHGLARIRLSVLSWISLVIAVLVAFAEWLALNQTGMPLTYANAVISVDWAREHPEVIPTVLPWSHLIGVLISASLYGGIPALAGHLSEVQPFGKPRAAAVTRIMISAAAVTFLMACFTSDRLLPSWSQTMSPTDGFWNSTIASLANIDRDSPLNLPAESQASLRRRYLRVAYPLGGPPAPNVINSPTQGNVLRHVIVVVLETAPQKYYRIGYDSSYGTFTRMAANSLVTSRHFTNRPVTSSAIYAILTGTYPRPGAPIGEYGRFRPDGLASVLGRYGYETTYIDSYKVDWSYHYRSELRQRGFQTILDTAGFHPPPGNEPFATAVARERWSMSEALDRVGSAQGRGKKALVVVATTLGHFPWRATPAMKNASSEAKMHAMGVQLDSAMRILVHGLDSLGLRDSVIVVVTGDHGLRYTAEFQSFGYGNVPGSDIEFNVPFMLYAPGLVKHRVNIPYATSHIDIPPTVYHLLGIPTDSLILDGENMLDTRLADGRAIFLMNTGIYPVDGFELNGHRFTSNAITGETRTTPELTTAERDRYEWNNRQIRGLLDSANRVFNLTAAKFLTRDRSGGPMGER
jgi:hypothetical protein